MTSIFSLVDRLNGKLLKRHTHKVKKRDQNLNSIILSNIIILIFLLVELEFMGKWFDIYKWLEQICNTKSY
jgi:amino acid transporter